MDRAIELRKDVLGLDAVTNAYRVVHSEGDGLPGFVADKIGDHLVIQVTSLGIAPFVPDIIGRLVERLAPASVIERAARVGLEEEGPRPSGRRPPRDAAPGPVEVVEHGVRFWCDVARGSEDRFLLRSARQPAAPPSRSSRDRVVLDAFCYVGGFGMNAAKAGARSVHFLDSSGPAIELARRGAADNGVLDRTTFEEANVLRALDHYAKEGAQFDVVMLDPPKLVHRQAELNKGLRLYFEINYKAVQVLNDGGILRHVLVQPARLGVGLRGRALERGEGVRGAAPAPPPRAPSRPDHPVMLPHAESRYLKCHVYRVLRSATKVEAGGEGGPPGESDEAG